MCQHVQDKIALQNLVEWLQIQNFHLNIIIFAQLHKYDSSSVLKAYLHLPTTWISQYRHR